ncbi:sugar ABC transporter substrate-binding protein [Bifidobacterium dolichotidis]|uniref:Sugar ABC transporter substrate-binding protein n=1 Tax=Bifidobacterium dolichotidis TaxID=2306976 RepID=A0A430FRE7_9BIFI|nr:FctA domain-containing protein [Bifidobacterium dolichotidis]RSX55452.1 sugar ABC transporter substrate-binding protein [Bifidobacterium dolichotidis]
MSSKGRLRHARGKHAVSSMSLRANVITCRAIAVFCAIALCFIEFLIGLPTSYADDAASAQAEHAAQSTETTQPAEATQPAAHGSDASAQANATQPVVNGAPAQPAANNDATPPSAPADAPEFTKQIHKNTDPATGQFNGTYTLDMSVKGKSSETAVQQATPLDVALVLDVSSSMLLVDNPSYSPVDASQVNTDTTYYVSTRNGYEPVTYTTRRVRYWFTTRLVTGWFDSDDQQYSPDSTQFYTQTSLTRIQILKNALRSFLTDINKYNEQIQDPANRVRVSLIKFAGTQSDQIGNDTYPEAIQVGNQRVVLLTTDQSNYSQIVTPLTDNLIGSANSVDDAVNALQPGGFTQADYGMDLAERALDPAGQQAGNPNEGPRQNAKRMVVFFSDGEPSTSKGSGYSQGVATDAIDESYKLKHQLNAEVYAINAIPGTDQTAETFMNDLSNNYPDAEGTCTYSRWTGESCSVDPHARNTDGDYYFAATSANALDSVFAGLSSTIVSGAAYQNIRMEDQLSDYVQFTQPDAAQHYGAQLIVKNAQNEPITLADAGLESQGQALYTLQTHESNPELPENTIAVQFPQNYTLRNGYNYVLEYTIKPTAKAYQEYVDGVNSGKEDPYNGVTGEKNTGDESEDQLGFRSNANAFLSYAPRVDGQTQPNINATMPHPVFQVDIQTPEAQKHYSTLTVNKHWLGKAARPSSIYVDLACAVVDHADQSCTSYNHIEIKAGANANADWSKQIYIPVTDQQRQYTLSEEPVTATVDGKNTSYKAAYDANHVLTIPANAQRDVTTTITNYPAVAKLDLSSITVQKTVANTDTDNSFSFTLRPVNNVSAESSKSMQTLENKPFTSATTTVRGPFTMGQAKTASFQTAVNVSLPDAQTAQSYRFTVQENNPDPSVWECDKDHVDVQLNVVEDTHGIPEFNDDGSVKTTVTYAGGKNATDTATNTNVAAFTNRLKPATQLPLTGEGSATPRLWLGVATGLGALALVAIGRTMLWRRQEHSWSHEKS